MKKIIVLIGFVMALGSTPAFASEQGDHETSGIRAVELSELSRYDSRGLKHARRFCRVFNNILKSFTNDKVALTSRGCHQSFSRYVLREPKVLILDGINDKFRTIKLNNIKFSGGTSKGNRKLCEDYADALEVISGDMAWFSTGGCSYDWGNDYLLENIELHIMPSELGDE